MRVGTTQLIRDIEREYHGVPAVREYAALLLSLLHPLALSISLSLFEVSLSARWQRQRGAALLLCSDFPSDMRRLSLTVALSDRHFRSLTFLNVELTFFFLQVQRLKALR